MKKVLIILITILLFTPQTVKAKQGCCSHHGGVKGCNATSGRYICNDGELSPSCECGNNNTYERTNESINNYKSNTNEEENDDTNTNYANAFLALSFLTGSYYIHKSKQNL